MKNDSGNLSIDFLAGFTVFMVALIWVTTMIPGLFLGSTAYDIDYDAVAYRTGVILVEDPGMPTNPPWETFTDAQKGDVERMGLALSQDTPNILSKPKIDRFFNDTAFIYPDDYQEKVIFGDHPYRFNISVITFDNTTNRSIGDVRPAGYGYIRRLINVKMMSNATVDNTKFTADTVSVNHTFSVALNMSRLLERQKNLTAYIINPLTEPVVINMTGLSGIILNPSVHVNLTQVNLTLWIPPNPPVSLHPLTSGPITNKELYVDGVPVSVSPLPRNVIDEVSLTLPFAEVAKLPQIETSVLFVNFSFDLQCPTCGPGIYYGDYYINSTHPSKLPPLLKEFDYAYYYDYNATRVTQPRLVPGVVEVAIW